MDHVLNLIAVSGSIKPSNVRLLAKPGHLTFRIASRITLNYTNRFFLGVTGIFVGQYVPVADRLERLRAGGNSPCQQLADFLGHSGIYNSANALIDSAVKLLSSRI